MGMRGGSIAVDFQENGLNMTTPGGKYWEIKEIASNHFDDQLS